MTIPSITVDKRGCGKGKTVFGIYPMISQNYLKEQNTLVVVPSIKLQRQYEKDLPFFARVLNSEISNGDDSTVVSKVIDAMSNNAPLIIITHAAFVKLPKSSVRSNYNLIIDEDISQVFTETKIYYNTISSWSPNFDFKNLYKFEPNDQMLIDEMIKLDKFEETQWFEAKQVINPDDVFLNDSRLFRQITDPNYTHYITASGWKNLNERTGFSVVINCLSTSILEGWNHIHIASAAFHHTKMYHWMKAHNIQMDVISEFYPHESNVKIYADKTYTFKWSNNKRKETPQILNDFHKFVKENTEGGIISLRNNGEDSSITAETLLSHNVHGMNSDELQQIRNISLESALIPSNYTLSWLEEWILSDITDKKELKQAINQMFMGHLFYQVIMRCALRSRSYKGELVKIFVLDHITATSIMDYFHADNMDVGEFDIWNQYKKKDKKPPMSPAERMKAYRARKKATPKK